MTSSSTPNSRCSKIRKNVLCLKNERKSRTTKEKFLETERETPNPCNIDDEADDHEVNSNSHYLPTLQIIVLLVQKHDTGPTLMP